MITVNIRKYLLGEYWCVCANITMRVVFHTQHCGQRTGVCNEAAIVPGVKNTNLAFYRTRTFVICCYILEGNLIKTPRDFAIIMY